MKNLILMLAALLVVEVSSSAQAAPNQWPAANRLAEVITDPGVVARLGMGGRATISSVVVSGDNYRLFVTSSADGLENNCTMMVQAPRGRPWTYGQIDCTPGGGSVGN